MPTGTATINFGSTPTDYASVVITGQAAIVSGSQVEAFFMADATAGNTADEHMLLASEATPVCGDIVAATGFTVHLRTPTFWAGAFSIRWVWI